MTRLAELARRAVVRARAGDQIAMSAIWSAQQAANRGSVAGRRIVAAVKTAMQESPATFGSETDQSLSVMAKAILAANQGVRPADELVRRLTDRLRDFRAGRFPERFL